MMELRGLCTLLEPTEKIAKSDNPSLPSATAVHTSSTVTTDCQTDSCWIDPMDMIVLIAENESLKRDLSKCSLELIDVKRKLKNTEEECEHLKKQKTFTFSIDVMLEDAKLIRYYTGFNKETFIAIFRYLVPDPQSCPLRYLGKGKLSKIRKLSLENQLFLTLCKLRNNFHLQDLAFRFAITQQVAGVIFNSWINYMFLRFGELSIWPHRDVLYERMPEDYRKDFPSTFPIVDCTEIRIEKPSSLNTQTQTYSNYKSTNTLKALVAVDPRGSVIFISMLFSGAMSDKEIFKQSGFQSTLIDLLEIGYLEEGDGIMADKGFDIEAEVEKTGLRLNIPPFAKSGVQMSQKDVIFTQKIAGHRVHVERAIRRIKSFKILSGRIQLSMMSSIDQIWYVCSFLTNFMPPCIRKK
ncbi:uncharacterized protein LOC124123830 isoform X2 [Haliotis rufescens]|uniref:uncharacterized protein LOC124123830 isoform X2 n=1 Tax=Haliotis rufescens TaxID=6454 RepID=UPI00201F6C4F|nr:uncharacterized protein LOC124123830 isoform X2 [Haliotis rufescens]XP_048245550.1 uncharacterized protein LOC124123830 isoform X2 [Haliotis rufescens]